ncbi:hypothetical protein A3735_27130 [Oleiphilus sp. HI0061]|uniref:hypothetical protein n=1 Tax=Oleiphilus sp. HI0061 TaxID=1822239 RepID=UPI0007CFAD3F|nr:hypothetical protein [Oleiphilus sp. HI0061]KZY62516.1 hypothetical protein A3735_27195 [Oleiphilus sp. HI0061]KZY62529.1 hypothetical protein A3735_27130 [Oleiphilus sp. HI0061]
MIMNMEKYCERCDDETIHNHEEKYERWMDSSIDDDDLSQSEVISRMNGDKVTTVTCTKCLHSYQTL